MHKLVILLVLPFLFTFCKGKKTKLADDDSVEIADFIDFFPVIKLPYKVSDTALGRKETDSSSIGYKVFTQFVPDTVLSKQFGKKVHPKIYPLGKVSYKKAEKYLFIKAVTAAKKEALVLVFNKDNQFVTSKTLIVTSSNRASSSFFEMDSKYTITIVSQEKGRDQDLLYKKDAYVYNSEGLFTLILTESNDISKAVNNIINPIDTVSGKSKFAGDYSRDKKNFISVRDGRTPASILFFVHFEKDNESCKGELKGEATFVNDRKAIFRQNGGPCVVEFVFERNTVAMKEIQACGAYRDIRCFFEGSFPKRKDPKSKNKKRAA